MATNGTTTRAAIYTRKSSLDERDGDNRTHTASAPDTVDAVERAQTEVLHALG